MTQPQSFQMADTVVALDDSCGARPIPVTETFWPDLMAGRFGTFSRLVSQFSYDSDWKSWERHPAGEEFVCLLEGKVEFILEIEGQHKRVALTKPGEFVLVPKNTWHTAKTTTPTRMLFITPGAGTENRPA
jgi:quercetin dioxygenase-like cupin family protein